MDQPLVDRRADVRVGQPTIAGTQAILRPGYAVSLIDLSSGGALIQGPRQLRPGSRVHLQLVSGNRRIGIAAHVLRCSVAALDSRHGVQYRGALKFDHRCDVLWENGTLDGYLIPGSPHSVPAQDGQDIPSIQDEKNSRREHEQD